MIKHMLDKLCSQMQQAVAKINSGGFHAASGDINIVLEALPYYEALGYTKETGNIQKLLLGAQSDPVMTLYCHSLILLHRKHYSCALEAIQAGLTMSPDMPILTHLLGKIQTSLGNLGDAYKTFRRLEEAGQYSGITSDSLFALAAEEKMPGMDYYGWLEYFHKLLDPASYVEIGLGHGRSLALAGAATKAIGIDPYQGYWEKLNYVSPHAPATLFPLTSDDFFAQHDLRKILGRDSFDLAFIDGLHLFEQVLKDFINLERYARHDSVILIHDCLPIAPVVAERERCTGFWTGDVWRIMPCLKTFRPDLKIMTIPAKPSGLGVVTNLDSASTVLSDNYNDIVRYYLSLHCPDDFGRLRMICSAGAVDEKALGEQFCRKL